MKNSEWINNVGVIWSKEKGKFTITLGDPKSKKNPIHVEVTVKNGEGKVLAKLENPMLTVKDPRTAPGLSEEAKASLPASLKYRLSLPPAKDE